MMNDSPKNGSSLAAVRRFMREAALWFICLVGHGTVGASAWFWASYWYQPHNSCIPWLACVAALVGMSAVYYVARRVSDRFKSHAVWLAFSVYIVGATLWLVLIPTFLVLDLIVNR